MVREVMHSRLSDWRELHPLPAAPGADSDGNGVTDFPEYALASAPRSASSRPFQAPVLRELRLGLLASINSCARDLKITLDTRGDLNAAPLATRSVIPQFANLADLSGVATTSETRLFHRLGVSLTP